MSHSFVHVYIHVIFATKDRRPWLTEDVRVRLIPYLGGIARQKKVATIAIGAVEDHVHVLLKLHSAVSIAKLIGDMKSYSSAFAKSIGVADFAWQEGYGAFSCSKNHVLTVKRYVENQEEHHRTHSFDDEMARLANIWGFDWSSGG